MTKVDWKPGTMIYPLPAVMVSLGETAEEYNIITIAWTGTLCSDPPMCYISVRPERHSYCDTQADRGIRHQPHHPAAGLCHRLVRRSLGSPVPQIR